MEKAKKRCKTLQNVASGGTKVGRGRELPFGENELGTKCGVVSLKAYWCVDATPARGAAREPVEISGVTERIFCTKCCMNSHMTENIRRRKALAFVVPAGAREAVPHAECGMRSVECEIQNAMCGMRGSHSA